MWVFFLVPFSLSLPLFMNTYIHTPCSHSYSLSNTALTVVQLQLTDLFIINAIVLIHYCSIVTAHAQGLKNVCNYIINMLKFSSSNKMFILDFWKGSPVGGTMV